MKHKGRCAAVKALASILSALLLLVLPCAPTLAASAPDILPVPGTHALLARCGEETFLIGGEDEQAVAQTIPNAIDGVIRLCEHVEHSAAVEALAARYGVSLYAPGDALPLDDAAWQGQTLRLSIGGTSYAFGADSAQEHGEEAGTASEECGAYYSCDLLFMSESLERPLNQADILGMSGEECGGWIFRRKSRGRESRPCGPARCSLPGAAS